MVTDVTTELTKTQQQFDYSVNLLQALLWQYNTATNLQGLLIEKQAWYDENQTAFWEDWFDNVFNLATANEFGLGVWAIILGIPLTLIQTPESRQVWGFDDNPNFDNASFTSGGGVVGLTLEEQRIILQLRYFQLTCNGTPLEINAFLKILFANFGATYVLDGLQMNCVYVFLWQPSQALLLALQNLDLLPRPAGVKIEIRIISGGIFLFDQPANFNNGSFGA